MSDLVERLLGDRQRPEARVSALAQLLGDERRDLDDRTAAAAALADLGDPAALGALSSAARDRQSPELAEAGVAALACFESPEATRELISTALRLWTTHDRREAATAALVLACERRGGPEVLAPWIDPSDWRSFRALIEALRQVGGPEAERVLRPHLFDAAGAVRTRVALALADLGWPADPADAPLAFHIVVGDWDACLGFGEVALPAIVEQARRGPERQTTAGAAMALAQAQDHASHQALIELGVLLADELAGETDDRRELGVAERLDSVADAIRHLGGAAAGPAIAALTREVPPGEAAERWLAGQLRWLPRAARLKAALQRVPHAPAWALPSLARLASSIRDSWDEPTAVVLAFAARVDGVSSPDDRVAAVQALAIVGTEGAVAPLMRAWQTAGDDAASAAAFGALVELGAPTVGVVERALAVDLVPRREWLITLLEGIQAPEATAALQDELERTGSDRVRAILARKLETGTSEGQHGP